MKQHGRRFLCRLIWGTAPALAWRGCGKMKTSFRPLWFWAEICSRCLVNRKQEQYATLSGVQWRQFAHEMCNIRLPFHIPLTWEGQKSRRIRHVVRGNTCIIAGRWNRKHTALKVPGKCPLVLLVKIGWRQCRALQSEECMMVGSVL